MTENNTYDISERVQRGIDLLNRQRPGWFNEIDTDRLSIWDLDDCVLGQLYGGYGAGLKALSEGAVLPHTTDLGVSYLDEIDERLLTEEWKARITELRKAEHGDE